MTNHEVGDDRRFDMLIAVCRHNQGCSKASNFGGTNAAPALIDSDREVTMQGGGALSVFYTIWYSLVLGADGTIND